MEMANLILTMEMANEFEWEHAREMLLYKK